MAFGLKCPECRKSFRYDPMGGHPRFCPLCKADIGGDEQDDNVICIPAFLSAATKATDKRSIPLRERMKAELFMLEISRFLIRFLCTVE